MQSDGIWSLIRWRDNIVLLVKPNLAHAIEMQFTYFTVDSVDLILPLVRLVLSIH